MCLGLLDNLLINLNMTEDHTKYIKAVFKWLAKSKLYFKYKKHTLFLPEVEFIGHVVLERGVLVSPGRVSTI